MRLQIPLHVAAALILLGQPLISNAQTSSSEPDGLLTSCTDSLSEIKKAEQTKLTGDDQACVDQIKKSWNNCYVADDSGDPLKPYSNDDDTASLYSNTGGATGDQKLIGAYTAGKTRALGRSDNCTTEKGNIQKVCGDRLQAIKNQISGIGQAQSSVSQTLSSTLGTDPNHAEFVSQQNQLHSDSVNLQGEREQLQYIQDAAVKAMNDRATCHANQAKLYDDGVNKTAAHLTSISSQDGQNTSGSVTNPTGNTIADQSIQNGEKAAVGNITKQGIAAVADDSLATTGAGYGLKTFLNTGVSGGLSNAVGDVAGDAASLGSKVLSSGAVEGAGIGTAVAGPVGTVVGLGVGATSDLATSATPAGSCSTIYIDPVVAYSNGCAANTRLAASILRAP